MDKIALDNITTEQLKNCINDLRDVLNEICCTNGDAEGDVKKLDISRELDVLIAEYMRKIA